MIKTKVWSGICSPRCWYALHDRCKCKCKGVHHAKGRKIKEPLEEYDEAIKKRRQIILVG